MSADYYKFYTHPLIDPITFRIHRCVMEIESLSSSLKEFLEENPVEMTRNISIDRRIVEFLISGNDDRYFFLAVSEELSDIFHRLRSVLDHMAVALALFHDPNISDDRRIYFPIYTAPKIFEERVKSHLSKIYPEEVIAVLRDFQPYNNPPVLLGLKEDFDEQKTNFLELLNGIINKDKHWRCLVGRRAFLSSAVDLEYSVNQDSGFLLGSPFFFEFGNAPRIAPGELVARIRSVEPFPEGFSAGVDLVTATVINYNGDDYPIFSTMYGILNEVMRVASGLGRFFASHSPIKSTIAQLFYELADRKPNS